MLKAITQLFSRLTKRRKPAALILLDIDGVLSFEGSAEDENFTTIASDWTTWRVKDTVTKWLKVLTEESNVELIWASAWEAEANAITETLALPELTYVAMKDTDDDDWLKTAGLLDFLETDDAKSRPIIIWLDDEFNEERIARFKVFPKLVCYKVNGITGLTSKDIKKITTLIQHAAKA